MQADRSIRVWDMRERTRPMITVAGAHDADVNVISWSRLANFMLASGGDDGVLRVWDLRHLSDAASRVAHLTHHKYVTLNTLILQVLCPRACWLVCDM